MGPGTRCLSLSSGPIESCCYDFKRGTPCSMPQLPHPYRGQDVFTHMTGAFGLCRSSRGPPVALRPQQGNVASGDTGSRPSAGPGTVKEGTGQRQPVPRGCPQRVPSLCWASSARAGCTPQAKILYAARKDLFFPRVCLPSALGSLCAQKTACLSASVPLCPQCPARGPACHGCSGRVVAVVSACTLPSWWVHRDSRGGQGRCLAWDLLSQPGPGLCGR